MPHFYFSADNDDRDLAGLQGCNGANDSGGRATSSYMSFLASTAARIAANVPERADVAGAAILGYN
ncbi:hypothetical protein LJR267_010109 [Paraburkholderia hospita]|jgi:hypothetical protein|uniref:hypothetical protein n=1 Tax=Paraburkholderia hospita TaxID=169430 RepID=UPI003ECFCCC3